MRKSVKYNLKKIFAFFIFYSLLSHNFTAVANPYENNEIKNPPPSSQTSDVMKQKMGTIDSIEWSDQGSRVGAEDLGGKSGLVQIKGTLMGVTFLSQCSPKNFVACIMAGLSFSDAIAAGGNKGNAKNFESQLYTPGQDNLTSQWGENSQIEKEIQTGLTDLVNKGIVTPHADGSVTLNSTGQKFTSEDFQSTQSLQRKGLSSQQAQQAMNQIQSISQKIQEKALKKNQEMQKKQALKQTSDSSSQKKGQFGLSSSQIPPLILDEQGESSHASNSSKPREISMNRGISSLEGVDAKEGPLFINFRGTPVGVRMSDIFETIRNKYTQIRRKSEHIKKEAGYGKH